MESVSRSSSRIFHSKVPNVIQGLSMFPPDECLQNSSDCFEECMPFFPTALKQNQETTRMTHQLWQHCWCAAQSKEHGVYLCRHLLLGPEYFAGADQKITRPRILPPNGKSWIHSLAACRNLSGLTSLREIDKKNR